MKQNKQYQPCFKLIKLAKMFLSFPKSERDIYDKHGYHLSKPWNAGAQFANVCMLTTIIISRFVKQQ